MPEHHRVEPHLQRLQQWRQHAVAGIALQAVAWAGVVQQGMVGGTHQHSIALADVGSQQFKLARRWHGRTP